MTCPPPSRMVLCVGKHSYDSSAFVEAIRPYDVFAVAKATGTTRQQVELWALGATAPRLPAAVCIELALGVKLRDWLADPETIARLPECPEGLRGHSLAGVMAATGINQGEIARELGVAQSTVSSWLRGRTLPSIAHSLMLERALGVPISTWVEVGPFERARAQYFLAGEGAA